MIIGVDGRIMQSQKAGMGYYLSMVIAALLKNDQQNKYKILGDDLGLEAKNLYSYSLIGKKRKLVNFLWKNLSWPKFENIIGGCDLGFFPNFVILPTDLKKTIVMIPDLSFLYYPEVIEPKNLLYLKKFVPPTCESAAAIITISQNTKNDLIKHFGVAADKIYVTPLAADPIFSPHINRRGSIRDKYYFKKKYILFVGTLEPRKNIEILVRAYQESKLVREKFDLVLAGARGWMDDHLQALLAQDDLMSDIKILGYVPQGDLPWLYSQASLFAFPSLYEGFGLPVIEAMNMGVPVICSNASSLPEVGGDAVEYFNPFDAEELKEKLNLVLFDKGKKEQMKEAGMKQARNFSWEKTAFETINVFKKVWAA